MRIARPIFVMLVCLLTACTLCHPKTDSTTTEAATKCNGTTCKLVIRIGTSCTAVDAANNALDHLNAQPGDTVCIFSDASGSVTVQFPTALIASPENASAPNQSYTLANGECASFVISDSAKNQTFSYQITGTECPTTSGGHGNPDVIVGGGGG